VIVLGEIWTVSIPLGLKIKTRERSSAWRRYYPFNVVNIAILFMWFQLILKLPEAAITLTKNFFRYSGRRETSPSSHLHAWQPLYFRMLLAIW
jgi:hypothetical protein